MRKSKFFKGIVSAVFWIGIWWILSAVIGKDVLLPSPVLTARALAALALKADFWISCFWSLVRICAGYFGGIIAGTLLGVLTYRYQTAEILFKPLQNVIKSTPVASFIIISLVWLGKNQIPSFISFLIVTPIVWSAVNASLKSCDRNLLEAADVFNLTFSKRLKYIYIPSVRKDYAAALETGLGMAWKAGAAAEVLALPQNSIGKELYNSKVYLESDKMFAWTLSIIVISFLLEVCLKKLLSRLLSPRRRRKI